jgi:hypothetical protein
MGGSLNPQCTPVNVIDTIRRSRLVTEKGEHRLRWDVFHDDDRPARVEDVHELALAMPYVTVEYGTGDNPVYQVGRKSFIFFRNPRPDAVDPHTGQRYAMPRPGRAGRPCRRHSPWLP